MKIGVAIYKIDANNKYLYYREKFIKLRRNCYLFTKSKINCLDTTKFKRKNSGLDSTCHCHSRNQMIMILQSQNKTYQTFTSETDIMNNQRSFWSIKFEEINSRCVGIAIIGKHS